MWSADTDDYAYSGNEGRASDAWGAGSNASDGPGPYWGHADTDTDAGTVADEAPADTDPHAWTWTASTFEFEGETFTEWHGSSRFHSATVTRFARPGWQAVMSGTSGEQRSPYRATPRAAQAWAERYGRPSH